MTSPRFIRGLQSYLDHWLEKTAVLDDSTIRELNPEFSGLLKAVKLGLVLSETQKKTAELILQCFFWVEQVGYVQVWQPLVESAVQCVPADYTYLRFRLLKQLGQLYRLGHQLDKAVVNLQQAEQLAHSLVDEQAVAELHMNLCQVYHLQGKYRDAEEYGRLALDCLADNQLKFKAITLRTMGKIAQEQGHLQLAEGYLQDSLIFSISPKERSLTLNVLAIIFQQREQYEQALETYDEILALLDRVATTRLFVELQLNKGSLLYSLGLLDKAEVIVREAEMLLRHRSGLFFYKALAANHLGCILREKQQFRAAETNFHRSIQQFRQIDSDIYQANACGNLAKLYARQERQNEAIFFYNEALRLVASYPDNAFAKRLQADYTSLRNEL